MSAVRKREALYKLVKNAKAPARCGYEELSRRGDEFSPAPSLDNSVASCSEVVDSPHKGSVNHLGIKQSRIPVRNVRSNQQLVVEILIRIAGAFAFEKLDEPLKANLLPRRKLCVTESLPKTGYGLRGVQGMYADRHHAIQS